jgi:hypothetical protein
MKALIAALFSFLLSPLAVAQESAAFLKIDVGARALGMGGAYTAVADDVNALAWNPGGLAFLRGRELGFMHAELAGGSRFDFMGYGQALKRGTIAAGARYMDQGSIDGRDVSGRPTAGFSASDGAADIGYGSDFRDNLGLGFAGRYVRSSIGQYSAQTFAADLGGIYRLERFGPGVPRLGLAIRNIGGGMTFLDESSHLPLTIATGLSYGLPSGMTDRKSVV